jgi:hypothetical protein
MKVTKAKGPNTDLAGLYGDNPRTTVVQLKRSLAADAMHPCKSEWRTESISFVVAATSASQIVLGPLLWLLSFGAQMKVARLPAETGGLSRSEKERKNECSSMSAAQ